MKGKVYHFARWAVITGLSLFLISARAAKRYRGPNMGRSADSQFTPADALERALKSASFDQYCGKSIWTEVYSLTERTGEESPEERFLRPWMGEKLISNRTRLASSKDQIEVLLDVKARVFGVHQTPRDFIPLVYQIDSTPMNNDPHR